ncbi:amino acid ABC transporter ATP-binding protein [Gordonia phthalatica]|uniref:Glutamine ABC transporter ATP-binding protein n=1 Tax=Gordonia phthalatica TaxID=1136941 RepID=A0A0N9N9R4_9ACTN|nr:amino acid ABC transporter ATP-binding protein [Gordonia phthalatica]ALG85012.1 glutamine ABC transporter ATP-binding protein [Gordonia phthalatica]
MTELIHATGLRKSFGAGPVLDGIDFAVESGSVTAVIGPSGSGKTTLLRSLNALDLPDAGVIRVADETVDFGGAYSKADLARYRSQSGFVFQNHNLFPHKTVIENVVEGPIVVQKRPADEARADARRLLESVGLGDRGDAYPSELSGGQQQRVGIVRAVALKPKVLLLDEPTSALDPELVGEVLRVIKDLAAEGWTMVVVTHEIEFARQVSDQVLFIDGGVIVERGAPTAVIDHPQHERTTAFLRRLTDPL